ncbi:hypothetical protein [Paremcibacter congregatus]|uniref:hypothetical protein n=1 Tax=Paremcibacter congregatus TaxID=2043170 RepID=UPI003A8CC11E
MMIFRYGGYVLFFGAVLVLGIEVLRYSEHNAWHLVTLEQAWRSFGAEGLDHAAEWVGNGPFPGVWEDVMLRFLDLPLLLVMAIGALILLFVSRRGPSVH